jgi:hypothetical protein
MIVGDGESFGIFFGVGGQPPVAVDCRAADVAPVVDLQAGDQLSRTWLGQAPYQEPPVPRAGVGYWAVGRVVVAEPALMRLDQKGRAARGDVGLHRAAGEIESRPRSDLEPTEELLRFGYGSPGVNHASQRVRSVGHRSWSTDHLGAFEAERVEVGRRRAGSAFGRDPCVVDQHQGAATGEAA